MKKPMILFIGLVLMINVALMGIGCSKAKQAEKEWEKAAPAETSAPEKPAEAPKQ